MFRQAAIPALALLGLTSLVYAEDTGLVPADKDCMEISPQKAGELQTKSGASFVCRTMLIVLDGPHDPYQPLFVPSNNSSIVCGWKLMTERPGRGASITVTADYIANNFQFTATADSQGAKLFARVQARWIQIADPEKLKGFNCDSDGFTLPTSLTPGTGRSGTQPHGCRVVNDGQHPPFLECS